LDPIAYTRQEIDLKKIIDGMDPSLNVVVHSDDLISIPKARMVYVVGEVGKPGGYVLDGHGSTISVLQVLALAGGVNKTAKAGDSKILHRDENGETRTETQIDVSKILASKSPDVSLHADEILFVPNSVAKNVTLRTLEAAVQIGTGMAIWRF
jgi:polysaccharide export outer membrane protein